MRRAGILLHPTSLPGPWGMGDIGPAARRWVAWLGTAKQTVWQFLPLQPADSHGSPYTSPSAFARNELLISLDDLMEDGWLRTAEIPPIRTNDPTRVDFEAVERHRWPALWRAAARARTDSHVHRWAEAHPWVSEWALFRSLWPEYGPCWTKWPTELRDRDPAAIEAAKKRLADDIAAHVAIQWFFAIQWDHLRDEARLHDVLLWGDLPIFVGGEACDVWQHRHLFRLDEAGRPLVVSGVPPDAFSKTGQLWGHPLYRNEAHAEEGYAWWLDRIANLLELADAVRLDHFRGIEAVWEIAAGSKDATTGRWVPGLGRPLLEAMQRRFDQIPLIAEDLGIITPEVEALRDGFGLPGMAILQFAFGNVEEWNNAHLPHNHRHRQVVYPGTHDNDPIRGWYTRASDWTRDHVRRYLSVNGDDMPWDMIRWAYRSVCETAIVQMQDLLSLGSFARMNEPGCPEGNWGWRMGTEAMNPALARSLSEQATLTGRTGLSVPVLPVSSPAEVKP